MSKYCLLLFLLLSIFFVSGCGYTSIGDNIELPEGHLVKFGGRDLSAPYVTGCRLEKATTVIVVELIDCELDNNENTVCQAKVEPLEGKFVCKDGLVFESPGLIASR